MRNTALLTPNAEGSEGTLLQNPHKYQTNKMTPQFLAKLRQLGYACNFKELDNMLIDRLVVDRACRRQYSAKTIGNAQINF